MSQVLTFDYLGALVVAVAFPLLFVPHLGLIRTGVFFGLLNAAVAVWALWLFRGELRRWRAHALACAGVVAALAAAMAGAEQLTTWAEDRFYGDNVVVRESSAYQRVVVTAGPAGVRLFLNGNLQFHSRDEYRYHEALVHPAMAAHGAPRRVLVLGGGDGMAVREVLQAPVGRAGHAGRAGPADDAAVPRAPAAGGAERRRTARARSCGSSTPTPSPGWSSRPRPTRCSTSSWSTSPTRPTSRSASSTPPASTSALDQHLAAGGFAVVQTTSPLIARQSFWTVAATLEAVGFTTTPYHAHVPSFGEWGFIIASRRPFRAATALPPGLRFLTVEGLPALLQFPPDMARVPAEPNRLSNQTLVHTFEDEWGRVQP